MKRAALLVGCAVAAIPSLALAAPFHLGDSTLWESIATGAGAQAAMWLGDVAPVAMVVVGLGLIITLLVALFGMIGHGKK